MEGDHATAAPLWELKLANEHYFASPLLVDGLLYSVSENRVLTVIDVAQGEVAYQERLRFKTRGAVVSSLAAAGPYFYVTNEAGSTKVLRLGRTFAEVGENALEHLRAVSTSTATGFSSARPRTCSRSSSVKLCDDGLRQTGQSARGRKE